MQKLYLIRHARPDIPLGKTRCIGSTDVPLGTLGKLQAAVLGEYLKDVPLEQVWASDLSRAVETARAIHGNVRCCPDLREMDAGDWDGLYFDQIRQRWPEIYEKRGTDPTYPIPGAEPAAKSQARFAAGIRRILEGCGGDVAVVAHATVIQSFLSLILGSDVEKCRQYPLDYTGICTASYADGKFTLLGSNEVPKVPLGEALCEKLLLAADAPRDHCRAVAREARRIAGELKAAGVSCDADLVYRGALLHDLARREPDHAEVGALWLEALGYPREAQILRTHHDPDTDAVCEKTVVFLADKLPLAQRFARSLEKCTTEGAKEAHRRRYAQAAALKEKINALCGKEIIQ